MGNQRLRLDDRDAPGKRRQHPGIDGDAGDADE